jgi:hypothetical protein
MRPENMPYYRGPRVQPVTKISKASDALHIQSILTDIVISSYSGSTILSNIPVRFGHGAPSSCQSTASPRSLLNLEFPAMLFRQCTSIGPFIHFLMATSPPQSNLDICLSISAWHVIPTKLDDCSLPSLRWTPKSSVAATISSTTSGHQERHLSFMATSSILITSLPAKLQRFSGNKSWPLSHSCG